MAVELLIRKSTSAVINVPPEETSVTNGKPAQSLPVLPLTTPQTQARLQSRAQRSTARGTLAKESIRTKQDNSPLRQTPSGAGSFPATPDAGAQSATQRSVPPEDHACR